MRINRLELNNFRNFESSAFNFLSEFTIIIGENGKGKSTILQGLRLAAATFLLGIDEAERYHIQKKDVRRVDLKNRFIPQNNCSFLAIGIVDSQEVSWKRSLAKPNGRTDYKEAAVLINIAQSLNDRVNKLFKEDLDLPVICFFSTARLSSESKQTIKLKKKGSLLTDGYARCIDERSDKKSPMEWVKSAYWKKLKEKPESALLDAVLEAIAICIPNWQPTEWDEDTDDLAGLYTDENGETSFVPLYYLSDGLRMMAEMVCEIAYRCVVLNAHHARDAVRNSKGIVLIDEIDMHLHPTWQQNVVSDLKKAFPNIQFVVTTHSPFIVQSLKSHELINLDRWTDIDPDRLNVGDISTSIMGLSDEFGSTSQMMHNDSLEYLKILESDEGAVDEQALLTIESRISDPGVRAFLQLQKLKKMSA